MEFALHPSLYGRICLEQDCLHISAELRGNLELDEFVARTEVPDLVWHDPQEFDDLFGERFSAQKVTAENDMQQYAIDLLHTAHAQKVTDIHITYYGPYAIISFRRMGLLQKYTQLDGRDGKELIQCIFRSQLSQSEPNFSIFERHDGRIARSDYLPTGLFAVRLHSEPIQSALSAEPGCHLAMRLLFDATSAKGTLEERTASLGFIPEQQALIRSFTERSGLTIISGATGHGKSTLLKNIMEALAEYQPTKNYFSLEDPPEYSLKGVKQELVTTNMGQSGDEKNRLVNILNALAGLMRSDPDIILVGEVRYAEVAQGALNAALTGHSVWTTLHASSGFGVIARLREMGIPMDSICTKGALNGIVYQRLMPILCEQCKLPLLSRIETLSPSLKGRLEALFPSFDGLFVKGEGCQHCDGLGMTGLQVAAEVIPITNQILAALRRGELEEAEQLWIRSGGLTHVAHALRRIAAGEVDPAIAEERLGVPLDTYLGETGGNHEFECRNTPSSIG